MIRATEPFRFMTASYLTRIENQQCQNLIELREGIAQCTEGSIFYHTFQSLGRHHFLTEGFSNDFAQWVLAGCKRAELAESLASLDIRDYVALGDLRRDLRNCVDSYCKRYPTEAQQLAFEPFYFCESIEEPLPLGKEAWTLEDFCHGLEQASHASLQFHFLSSRLRLHLRTNDFSQWFARELKLESLARFTDRIDVYTNTLEGARSRILAFARRELRQ